MQRPVSCFVEVISSPELRNKDSNFIVMVREGGPPTSYFLSDASKFVGGPPSRTMTTLFDISHRLQRIEYIVGEIVRMLKPHRQTHKPFIDALFRPLLDREALMRGGRRMRRQRF